MQREIYCPTDLVLLLPGAEHGLEVLLPAHVEDADHVGGVVEAGAVQRHVAEPRARAVAGLLHQAGLSGGWVSGGRSGGLVAKTGTIPQLRTERTEQSSFLRGLFRYLYISLCNLPLQFL